MTDKIIVGEIDWMRNDYPSDITIGGIVYPSVEHAYQAAKFSDIDVREQIAEADDVRAARKLGREMPGIDPNWDARKSTVMEQLVRAKFTQDTVLGERLAKTGSANIVMEGYDSFWGTGRDGDGDNQLGEILETIRSEVQFITGIDPADYDESEEEDEYQADNPPTLKEALENNPDDDLLSACQDLYDGTRAMMTLIDTNDYDADFICRRTGVSRVLAESAIRKLQKMQGALSKMNDLLSEEDSDQSNHDDDVLVGNHTWKGDDPKPANPMLRNNPVQVMPPEDDDEDHPNDDWLSSFD
jgi:ribA/ribD-fused uncharacterized protein